MFINLQDLRCLNMSFAKSLSFTFAMFYVNILKARTHDNRPARTFPEKNFV